MCDLPDDVPAGEDLFVHCVPQPGVGAKLLAFYYRSGGLALYNAVMLERSRKGWYVATIPGNRVSGRLLHYYVEARDAKEKVAASNGKANSPNVVSIKAAAGGGKVAKKEVSAEVGTPKYAYLAAEVEAAPALPSGLTLITVLRGL